MRRRKEFAAVFLLALLLLTGTAFGAAESVSTYELVYDMADLFTDEEERALSDMALALSEAMGMEAAVVTAGENDGTAEAFADRFYEEQGLGTGSDHSGVLLLMDMANRELWISTEGAMVRYLTDSRLDAILDDVVYYMADGDYFQAASVFFEDTEAWYDSGIIKNQYNQEEETGRISRYRRIEWYELVFAAAAASVCGGTAVLSVVRSYGMKDEGSRMEANFRMAYRKDSSFTPGRSLADVLLRTYVTQQVIAAAARSSSGGSRGGRSGASGRRSTTHRSPGGRSHGGRGRKF